jgi:hypothetical protein
MGSFRCVIYAFVLISLLENYCGLWMFLCLINSLQFLKVLLVYVDRVPTSEGQAIVFCSWVRVGNICIGAGI